MPLRAGHRSRGDSRVISVVVATYNRSTILKDMIRSFYAQTGLEVVSFELLVVDNNSSDATAEAVREFAGAPGFRYIFEARQGLSCARNRGVAEARGDIVSFLDDDVIVGEHLLTALQRSFEETGADAIGGRSYLVFDSPPPDWFGADFRRYLSEVDLGNVRCDAGSGVRLFGLNLSIKRAQILRHGGFDENLGRTGTLLLCGEERALLQKIYAGGGRNFYEPEAVVGHRVDAHRLNWDYFVRLSAGAGQTRAMLDAPAGIMTRCVRVAETAAKLALYTALLVPSALILPGRYLPRALYCRQRRIRALLGARARRLLS